MFLVTLDERMTLAVPGTSFTADLVLDALARFAKAVGARPESFSGVVAVGRLAAPGSVATWLTRCGRSP